MVPGARRSCLFLRSDQFLEGLRCAYPPVQRIFEFGLVPEMPQFFFLSCLYGYTLETLAAGAASVSSAFHWSELVFHLVVEV